MQLRLSTLDQPLGQHLPNLVPFASHHREHHNLVLLANHPQEHPVHTHEHLTFSKRLAWRVRQRPTLLWHSCFSLLVRDPSLKLAGSCNFNNFWTILCTSQWFFSYFTHSIKHGSKASMLKNNTDTGLRMSVDFVIQGLQSLKMPQLSKMLPDNNLKPTAFRKDYFLEIF